MPWQTNLASNRQALTDDYGENYKTAASLCRPTFIARCKGLRVETVPANRVIDPLFGDDRTYDARFIWSTEYPEDLVRAREAQAHTVVCCPVVRSRIASGHDYKASPPIQHILPIDQNIRQTALTPNQYK